MTDTGQDSTGRQLPLIARVFAAMADGELHSGETLAAALGVSRSAVWKAVEGLRALGATLHAVPNRGYRLVAAAEPLDAARIRAALVPDVAARVRMLEVAWSLGSTNTVLLERADLPPGKCEVLLAEYQSAGRGRRGRVWLAPPGGSLCMSLSWTFQEVPRDLGALGLVVGLCVLRALKREGLTSALLKWPNDVLVNGRKLCGVLIELRAEGEGPACVVIGVGINVALGSAILEQLERAGAAPADLVSCGLEHPSRNRLAAGIIEESLRGLEQFASGGLKGFVEEWRAADVLRGRMVDVNAADGLYRGLARGIDVHGALMVETPQGLKRFLSGDVTVRPA
jgi:BirA family biotin operon repressor/biotin-[acetyl-CoA-carboxylase] ligase